MAVLISIQDVEPVSISIDAALPSIGVWPVFHVRSGLHPGFIDRLAH
ncbi:hypothetical protein [Acrocarpospora phusangensis]|nr:hypothetical protein [Acrocarpospora phusangensis]